MPCKDITLTGHNFESGNPLKAGAGRVSTGAYSAFGSATQPGHTVRGQLPCSGAVMRVASGGGALELVEAALDNALDRRHESFLGFEAPGARLRIALRLATSN